MDGAIAGGVSEGGAGARGGGALRTWPTPYGAAASAPTRQAHGSEVAHRTHQRPGFASYSFTRASVQGLPKFMPRYLHSLQEKTLSTLSRIAQRIPQVLRNTLRQAAQR